MNEQKIADISVGDYMAQVEGGNYNPLTPDLFDMIEEEGWLFELEEEFGAEYDEGDFEYMTLDLTEEDKKGLLNFDNEIVEKFNAFDIELKALGKYPFSTLDFIDYDKGIVYIIRLLPKPLKYKEKYEG